METAAAAALFSSSAILSSVMCVPRSLDRQARAGAAMRYSLLFLSPNCLSLDDFGHGARWSLRSRVVEVLANAGLMEGSEGSGQDEEVARTVRKRQ